MVLRFLSRTPLRHLVPRDTPPADSRPATSQSQGGSGNGARADVARAKTKEAEHILANLEKEGVEIDGKIASLIDDELARIKAEAAREKINEPRRIGAMVLDTVAWTATGFMMGVAFGPWALFSGYRLRPLGSVLLLVFIFSISFSAALVSQLSLQMSNSDLKRKVRKRTVY